jgi:DNA-binding CsgD family transcriptional regulator
VAAHRGDAEAARALADEVVAFAERSADPILRWRPRAALGLLELSLGNAGQAHTHLSSAADFASAAGWGEPAVLRFHHDDVEALLAMRQLTRAEELVELLEERAQALGRPWGLAVSARCRGLLWAARGDVRTAQESLEQALEAHEMLVQPFEQARTLLTHGQILRRAKQKRAARESLDDALGVFEGLGARLWAQKTRSEIARIGGRRPAGDELTPTERRLAELVSEGRSNKEIAAALFVTPKTVGTKLSRIYAKLDVHSRTELVRRLSERSPSKV